MKNTLLTTAAAITALSLTNPAEAASSQRVMFESNGQRLVGDLYLPDDHQAGEKLPAVIVSGSWTSVKEQMPATYAAEMADRGFAALAFDFTGWGQSEGSERQIEDPITKTADIVAAAEFLASHVSIDPDRIAALGICASAGYAAGAAVDSPYIRSVALVAPWLHDAAIVDAVYGGSEAVAQLIAVGEEAEASENPMMITAASTTDDTALMQQAPYYTDSSRGLIPEYVNQFNLASWKPWLTYDAIAIAAQMDDLPVAIMHSQAAAIPQGAEAFYTALKGPKTQKWLDNVGQLDFYDQTDPVRQAADFAADHFHQTLR